MATLREARLARKAAIERFRYYRKKHNVTATKQEIQELFPTVSKGKSPEQYDKEIAYFKEQGVESMEEIINRYYLEPEDETAPYHISTAKRYYDELFDLNDKVAQMFGDTLEYVKERTNLSAEQIDDILDDATDYIEEIEEEINKYIEAKEQGWNDTLHNVNEILVRMRIELFWVF